jgi:hypothetical protein
MNRPRVLLCAALALAGCALNSSDSLEEIDHPLSGVGTSVNALTCAFPNTVAVCTLRPSGEYDTTYALPSGCPIPQMKPWDLQEYRQGAPGPSIPWGPDYYVWVLGHQARGAVTAGPAVGSMPEYQMCDEYNYCYPFTIDVPDCYAQDQLFDANHNQTLQVTQDEALFETLEMAGPWVNRDVGVGAQGKVVTTTLPNNSNGNSPITFRPGYATNIFCGVGFFTSCTGFIPMAVQTDLSTPPGDYTATVSATDIGTNITRNLTLPIHVSACTPPPACTADMCGTFTSCGQSVDCSCSDTTNVCSAHHCCPAGTVWDGNVCTSACNCKRGFYCDYSGQCVRNNTCGPGTCM